jgi:hypothetical protein
MDADPSSRHVPLLDSGDGDYSSSSTSSIGSTLDKIRSSPKLKVYLAVIVLVAVIIIGLTAVAIRRNDEPDQTPTNPYARAPAQVANCLIAHSTTHHPPTACTLPPNPAIGSLLLRNALVHDGLGAPPYYADLLLSGGKIQAIATPSTIPPLPGVNTTHDLQGRHITPGLVDMHSHIGVDPWPGDLWATQDGNEMTNVVFPQVRALDALNPQDKAILWTRRGGVTTSQILPGLRQRYGRRGNHHQA